MSVGRLVWRTPAWAMLWEIGARYKLLFILQAAALLGAYLGVHGLHRLSRDGQEIFTQIAFQAGGMSVLLTLASFCHMEIDSRRFQAGFPGHLFLKPVSTIRMVTLPMVCGGTAVVAVFLAWIGLIWRHLGFPTAGLPWICAALFSTTWSVQAIGWSTANLLWGCQAALMMAAVGANALAGLAPMLPVEIHAGWRLVILGVLLASSFAVASYGVQRARQGAWESSGSLAVPLPVSGKRRLKKFRSAFWAQFWLEWRRMGWTLPIFTGLGLLVIIGLAVFGLRLALRQWGGEEMLGDPSFRLSIIGGVILTPILCSVFMSAFMANFDTVKPASEIPVFVAIRPMTNGTFVAAKLTMAAASSCLTWIMVLAILFVWLAAGSTAPVSAEIWRAVRSQPGAFALLLCSFPLITLLIWRNMIAGMWAGMTGRPQCIGALLCVKGLAYIGLPALAVQASHNAGLKAVLLQWLPYTLWALLAGKLLLSAAAFRTGLRWNAITGRVALWIITGWFLSGLFVAMLSKYVCATLQAPGAWLWITLGGFILLPFAELAISPLALRWNRHR